MGSILLNLIISLFPPNTALKFLYTRNASFGCPYTVSIDHSAESDDENDEAPKKKPKRRGQRGMSKKTPGKMTLHDTHN